MKIGNWYHVHAKVFSRSAGERMVAKAAYRSATKLADERYGDIADYSRRTGVEHTGIILPTGAPQMLLNREVLWNAAEAAEDRSNSDKIGREYEIALPRQVSPADRLAIVQDISQFLVDEYGVAADYAIHEPHKRRPVKSSHPDHNLPGGDDRNWHAHILVTRRRLDQDGYGPRSKATSDRPFGKAVDHLDGPKRAVELEKIRAKVADVLNTHLERLGIDERVDHRSHKDRKGDQQLIPVTPKIGVAALAMERKGIKTERAEIWLRDKRIQEFVVTSFQRMDETKRAKQQAQAPAPKLSAPTPSAPVRPAAAPTAREIVPDQPIVPASEKVPARGSDSNETHKPAPVQNDESTAEKKKGDVTPTPSLAEQFTKAAHLNNAGEMTRLAPLVITRADQRKHLLTQDARLLNKAYDLIPATPETENLSRRIGNAIVAAAPSAIANLDKEAGHNPSHTRDRRQQNTLALEWEEKHKPNLSKIHSSLPNMTLGWANRMRELILNESDSALKTLRQSAMVSAMWLAKRLQVQGLVQPNNPTDPKAIRIIHSKNKDKAPGK
jgi:hypothetical protein